MQEKQTILLIGLTALILILTGAGIRSTPSSSILGTVAPIIIPALMTWYLLVILAYARKIIDILAAFLLPGPRKEGRRRPGLVATIVAWVILILIVSILVRPEFVRALAGTLMQAAAVLTSTISAFRQPSQLENPTKPSMSTSDLILYYYTAIIFGAIVIVSMSLFFGAFHEAYKEIHSGIGKQGEEELRQEMLGVVQGTRTRLEARERYHETILDCYRQMCEILSGNGYIIRPAQTAREFALNLSGKLKLGVESVNGLTFLFEEARYSRHEMGDDKRGMALNYLNSLEQILKVGVKR